MTYTEHQPAPTPPLPQQLDLKVQLNITFAHRPFRQKLGSKFFLVSRNENNNSYQAAIGYLANSDYIRNFEAALLAMLLLNPI
ncbi:hypothetical protein V3C99_014883 [Haemonchus contortus]